MESFSEQKSDVERGFVFPDIEKERGEIERVAQKYNPQNPEVFVRNFYEKAQQASLVDLTEEMWSILDNTDSFDISGSGWKEIAGHINHTNQETGSIRDWEDLKRKMEQGQALDAPIVLKYSDDLHLVSGNTRLMVARALTKIPQVLLVEM